MAHFNTGKVNKGNWEMHRPLLVEGCMILLCERGSMEFTINSGRCVMYPSDFAIFVFDMVAVPVRVSADFSAKFITLDFDTAQDIFFLVTSNRLWDYIYTRTIFKLDEGVRQIALNWIDLIIWLLKNCAENTIEKVLHNEMESFMSVMTEYVESQYGVLGTNPAKNRAWVIANDFLGLVNRYYTHHHDVAFYAEKLNITPNYLNITSRRNFGVSAKEQINIQLGLVVKMLLDTTALSVKEIAEKLHYDDPSYLCRIFRKQTGMSPLQYRNRQIKEWSGLDDF